VSILLKEPSAAPNRVIKLPQGGSSMARKTIQEMEKELGFDKVNPIALSPSDGKELKEKGDPFKDWYEEELRSLYEDR